MDSKPIKSSYYKTLVAPLITKSMDWKYEDEHRIVFASKNSDLKSRTLKNAKIIPVYLGYRISDSNKSKLLNLLKTDDFKNVNIFQANLSDTKFKMKMIKINER